MEAMLCLAGLVLAAASDESVSMSCLQHHAWHVPRKGAEMPGDLIEEEPASCQFQQQGFLRPSQSGFDLDLAVLQRRSEVAVLVTAMSLGGVYSDTHFDITRAEPLEDSENTLLIFKRSADGQGVDIYQPSLGIRTSDRQSVEAVDRGLGDGWLGTLPRLSCDGLWAVDGEPLLLSGFYVASQAVAGAADYRVLKAKSYPSNLDVAVEYSIGGPPLQVGFSVILLPEEPMVPRASDDRLLFFTSDFQDIGYREAARAAPSHVVDRPGSVIWKYNLEALPGRQIRIFVDPSVPLRWREWFRQGVEAWNDAFSYKAVHAVLPEDADWPKDYDLSDGRFSTISWDVSDEVLSMGIAKVDPRSGEILKSDITMSNGWVKAWLEDLDSLAPGLTQHMPHGPSKPRVTMLQGQGFRVERFQRQSERRTGVLNATQLESLMGMGLKSIVMHETGHTLGLRHNFKGSLAVSLECLQDKRCTARTGLSASVMDYVPPNIPDADAPEKVHAFSPVIGAYDKLAIAFGYTPVQKDTWPEHAPELQKILKEAENYEVCYDDSESGEDPKCMAYDMSQDPLSYFEQEFHRIVGAQQRLLEASVGSGEPFRLYGEAASMMLFRSEMIGEKLVKWIGGIEDHFEHQGEVHHRAARPIPRPQQQRALALLLRILRPHENGLVPPEQNWPFLVEGEREDQIQSQDVPNMVHLMSGGLLEQLLSAERLVQITRQEALSAEALSLDNVMEELISSILNPGLTKAATGKRLSPQEMDLQLMLVSKLKDVYTGTSSRRHKSRGQDLGQAKTRKGSEIYFGQTEELPLLREPIASKLLFFLQQAREQTLSALEAMPEKEEAPLWHRCAELSEPCRCAGMVRLAGEDGIVGNMRAVDGEVTCLLEKFQAEAAPGNHTDTKRWCECLLPGSVAMSRPHLNLLMREFAGIFCEEFETCESPRVRLAKHEESTGSESKPLHLGRYWLTGGILMLVALCGFIFLRRR